MRFKILSCHCKVWVLPVFLVHTVCKMLYERLGAEQVCASLVCGQRPHDPFCLEHLNFVKLSHKTLNSFPFLLYFFHTFLKFLRRISPRECTYSNSRRGSKDFKICLDFIAFKAVLQPCRVCGTELSPGLFPTWACSAIAATWGRCYRNEFPTKFLNPNYLLLWFWKLIIFGYKSLGLF